MRDSSDKGRSTEKKSTLKRESVRRACNCEGGQFENFTYV